MRTDPHPFSNVVNMNRKHVGIPEVKETVGELAYNMSFIGCKFKSPWWLSLNRQNVRTLPGTERPWAWNGLGLHSKSTSTLLYIAFTFPDPTINLDT